MPPPGPADGRTSWRTPWHKGALAVELAAAPVALATLAAFGAREVFVCELIVHWRVVLGLLLLVAALVSLAARHARRGVLALALAGVNAWCVAPLFPGAATTTGTAVLRVFHANVEIANQDFASVARAIAAADADVVVLQEVGPRWLAELAPALAAYPQRVELPRDDPFGLALYSRFALEDARVVALGERATPSIRATVLTQAGPITLFAAHPRPPMDPWSRGLRDAELGALAQAVRATSGAVVVVGDLNTSPLAPSFQDLLEHSGLRDGARGPGWPATWPAPLPALLRIRLDHVLHSADLSVRRYEVGEPIGSDHRPLVVELVGAGAAR